MRKPVCPLSSAFSFSLSLRVLNTQIDASTARERKRSRERERSRKLMKLVLKDFSILINLLLFRVKYTVLGVCAREKESVRERKKLPPKATEMLLNCQTIQKIYFPRFRASLIFPIHRHSTFLSPSPSFPRPGLMRPVTSPSSLLAPLALRRLPTRIPPSPLHLVA